MSEATTISGMNGITAVAEPQQITLTREQYDQLLAGRPKQTVTVDADEYAALVAFKTANEKIVQQFDRTTARLREVEMLLRREQAEHTKETDQLVAQIKQLGG